MNIIKIYVLFLLFLVIASCYENERDDQVINLEDLSLDLEFDLNKGIFEINESTFTKLASDLTEYIYNDSIESDEPLTEVKIRIVGEKIYLNYEDKELQKILNKRLSATLDAPCKPQSENCSSRKCVEELLKKIYGPGKDVDVKFRRNTFSVTITWTYFDC